MLILEQIHSRFSGEKPGPADAVVYFCKKEAVVRKDYTLPRAEELPLKGPFELEYLKIGTISGTPCFGAELPELPELPEHLTAVTARSLLCNSSTEAWNALCRARELLFWRKQHRYCGSCRTELLSSSSDSALICPQCHAHYYPQIAPAVIVAVTRDQGKELLLAHNRSFEPGVFGLLAGFVESGETVEQTIEREIMEETGIRVGAIRYLGSQPWPFPNSLMLAFRAEYVSGTLHPDGTELAEAGWFPRNALPKLPPAGSIARQIIENFLNEENKI